jgi:hypothetical protein
MSKLTLRTKQSDFTAISTPKAIIGYIRLSDGVQFIPANDESWRISNDNPELYEPIFLDSQFCYA